MNDTQPATTPPGATTPATTRAGDADTKWRVADLIIKGIGAALIGGAITLVGHWFDVQQRKVADESARVRAVIEFASGQKTFDANVGMKLLEKFFDYYLREKGSITDPAQAGNMLVLLRLITLNFQDVPINLKPLYQDFDRRLTKSKSADVPMFRRDLRALAQEVARRQAFRISYLGGILSQKRIVRVGEEASFTVEHIPFIVLVTGVERDGAEIELYQESGIQRYGPIHASVFDSPLVDNIKVDTDTRLAVLLDRVDAQAVTIRVVSFSADLAADRFDIKEMTRDLYNKNHG